MCCFSRDVQRVADTRIFCRRLDATHQAIAYQMSFAAAEDLAMILPLPVVVGSGEKAVEFINLEGYDKLFADLKLAFPSPKRRSGNTVPSAAVDSEQILEVQSVGSFEASFVPTIADFSRLDPRFRIEPEVWKKLPTYADFGFAVFKLKKGDHKVHPMALKFPSRHPEKLFFPTVHIHDGEVHEKEDFDHELYCQVNRTGLFAMTKWDESQGMAKATCQIHKTKGLLDGDRHLYRRRMKGNFKNEDIILATS